MHLSLTEAVQRADVAGCAVGMLREGHSPEFLYHGQRVVGGKDITGNALWEAASLSKPLVALLAIQGVLGEPMFLTQALSTDLLSIGASGDSRWPIVTPFHLLTHTSGLPNWREDGYALEFESDPGTAGYSGEGYELLLSELSTRSGQPAEVILDEHLRRLGMASSTFTPRHTKPFGRRWPQRIG